ncbi:ATP-binding cassette domain-containing protein [Mucilaginibacter robiniae]|uniref:ATP-binding cassette domain-containing protein n=1 Tax=Mucilaginibacter robiniae TaxID=2728022 RepID=A0A7L5E7M3_9SPHI|nr:ATP-binding cassette domain-containing protein [Mucilaginibacter robiniae]
MSITLENAGRRFNRDWIFRKISYTFQTGDSYAILGPNGSGKSTILQLLNGSLSPSEGKVSFLSAAKPIEAEHIFRYLSLAAPYLELIEDFTLNEVIDFHFKFKNWLPDLDKGKLIDLLGMQPHRNKLVRYFSSGMKQRLKLALAFGSATPILMLDEPTSNLDTQGVAWYLNLIEQFTANRLLIVCSNQEQEYSFCHHRLHITDYK